MKKKKAPLNQEIFRKIDIPSLEFKKERTSKRMGRSKQSKGGRVFLRPHKNHSFFLPIDQGQELELTA